ncbi:MAG: primosomal protein N' [Dehalococcoidales bacterium]|nr:primosomal protein N' [Dehalococcoidales bacterium]
MLYAEVSVNSPSGIRPTFSYHIPEGIKVQPGQAVWVPFGKQLLQGVVISISDTPGYEQTRAIAGIIEPPIILEKRALELAEWISSYYLCPLFQSLALLLPPGFTRSSHPVLSVSPQADPLHLETLEENERKLYERIAAGGPLEQKEAENIFGKRQTGEAASGLISKNLIHRTFRLGPARVSPKTENLVGLTISQAVAREEAEKLKARSPRQAALMSYLVQAGQPAVWKEIRLATGTTISARQALEKKGFINVIETETPRRPLPFSALPPEEPLTPNDMQARALAEINKNLKQGACQTFLLHGVTASGKTEIYLQALARVIELGKKGIVLVPEISLTPQTINRFTARFPNQVAVLHSSLSMGERYDQWREIRDGKYDVVIGARSALFAPLPDLGLVVIDEEHEWSYKQDTAPRYHARTTAEELCRLSSATLILGSATPDVETYYKATTGRYRLLELPERITQGRPSVLPEVQIVDLREELRAGNRSIFSRALQAETGRALERKEQIILFLNRRGGATFVQCRNCGYVVTCRRCHTALSYHPNEERLICHHCNLRAPVPVSCPKCASNRIKYLGLGTQGVEAEITRLFPQAKILRWDSDSTRAKDSHETHLKNFTEGKADILIGTQMIAKGMDFPGVSVVGVINADTGINLPDFRAGEQTFSLLCQVAGRAGRGKTSGQVIIQSYHPGHYAIQAAANHDYTAFFNTEIAYRRSLNQPPFLRLARLIFAHTNDDFCRREAFRLKQALADTCNRLGLPRTSFIGPAPAFYHRLRGRYRWSIIIKSNNPETLLNAVKIPPRWKVDIDPIGLD